jgi:hypothetical protein
MLYIDPNGNYPKYYGDIMNDTPGWNLGDDLPEGWQLVADAPAPEVLENQTFYDGDPEIIDGILTRTFIIRDLTTEELALREAPKTARQKLVDLGFSEAEIETIRRGIL